MNLYKRNDSIDDLIFNLFILAISMIKCILGFNNKNKNIIKKYK